MERRIGIAQGTAIYVGAILGAGLLALPALAAAAAGPASILAWGLLLVFCVPVAATFAALGARYPDSGGISTFVSKAFGPRASAVAGYWFYFALPAGAPATAYVGGQYVAHSLGAGPTQALVIAAALLTIALAFNGIGLTTSGRVQLMLVGVLVILLLIACIAALPSARTANLTPFAPQGMWAIGGAASLLFFSFAGWEAVTHLSGEFRDPAHDLRRITVLTLIIVAVLYLGLSITSVMVLGPELAETAVPLSALLEVGVGSSAAVITAIVAALLTLGTMTAFLAGASRLGAALARDGALPSWLAKGSEPGQVPRRSLSVLAILSVLVSALALVTETTLDTVMLAAAACFVAVTVAGLVAGIKLLPTGRPVWFGAVIATLVMTIILVFSEWMLAIPLTLGVVALGYTAMRSPAAQTPATTSNPQFTHTQTSEPCAASC